MEENSTSMIKIAITGPESTGKSWLSEQLAAHYKTVWVKEYAREYLAEKKTYQADDVVQIAVIQHQKELEKSNEAKQLLICDTDMLVCKVWLEIVFNQTHETIEELVKSNAYDFTLLCDIDLPWQPDPLREHPTRREEIFDRYLYWLQTLNQPFEVVNGKGEQRLECAINRIDAWLEKRKNQK